MQICGKDIMLDGSWIRIARLDGDKYTFPDNIEETLAQLRKCGRRIDLFTFMQHPPDITPRFPYPMEWDNLAVLPVVSFDHWWNHQLKSIGRNRARQGEKKGLTVGEIPFDDRLLKGIVEIHNETPLRQGRRFPHYGMDLEGARRYAGTFLDRTFFIGAFVGEALVGYLKLTVNETQTHACAVSILSRISHRDKAPTNALIAQAVRSCVARGIRYLVYENFHYGRKVNDGLSHFKQMNGFQRMDLPRYYVPLSAVGAVAWRLGLHRRLIEYAPEFLTGPLRQLRTRWLEWRYGWGSDACAGRVERGKADTAPARVPHLAGDGAKD
jgi:hypothetical protein